jgi:hypothetical protein
MCQAHRCAGAIQPYADHRAGSRRDHAGSPARHPHWGANRWARFPAAHCGALRNAPAAESPRPVVNAGTDRTPDWRWLDNPATGSRRRREGGCGQTPPAARVSFAATSDSRDRRSGKARPQRDCRVGLRDPTRVAKANAEGAAFPRDVRGSKNEMRAAGGGRAWISRLTALSIAAIRNGALRVLPAPPVRWADRVLAEDLPAAFLRAF